MSESTTKTDSKQPENEEEESCEKNVEVDWKTRIDTIESVVVHQQEQIRMLEAKNREQTKIFEAKNKVLELQLQQLQNQLVQQEQNSNMQNPNGLQRLQRLTPCAASATESPSSICPSSPSFISTTTTTTTTTQQQQQQLQMQSPRKKTRVKKSMLTPNGVMDLKEFPQRKHLPHELHSRVSGEGKSKNRRSCAYCSLLYMQKKKQEENVSWDAVVRRTNSECSYCKVVLCRMHFKTFHDLP